MERVRFIDHAGTRVVLLDFTGIKDEEEALREISIARSFFARLSPDGSLLTVTDVTDANYTQPILEALMDLARHNRPYVKAAAVVTPSPFHRAAATMIALFSRRTFEGFDTREAALDWLVAQK